MGIIKKITVFILILLSIQSITYYTLSKRLLVNKLGRNFISYILHIEDNKFNSIGVISNINLTEEAVLNHFIEFASYSLKVCDRLKGCAEVKETKNYYLYFIDSKTNNPFAINIVIEGESAKEYGAGFESKYIWVLFRWILLEKINTGIS